MRDYFQTLSKYNRWANSRLYDAVGQLSKEEYFLDRKAFFTSIHGTLNHLLVADRLWLGRLQGIHSGIMALNQILYDNFVDLLLARKKEDENIIQFIHEFDNKKMNEYFHFTTLAGKENSIQYQWLFAHFFNHQTHHRGQVHNMLSQASQEPPALDIYYFINEV